MDAVQLDDNIKGFEDEAAEQLLPSCSFSIDDILGNQYVLPRVSDLYQAEIPSLIPECDRLHVIEINNDIKPMVDVCSSSFLGLPIPIVWAHDEVKNVKQDTLQVLGNRDAATNITEPLEFSKSRVNRKKELSEKGGDNMDIDPILHQERKGKLFVGERGCCPLPASLSESWSDLELESFLLGLYIFGKNLVLVQRFVASKEMGDILCFYYGKFYRSSGYRRWSDCRKIRSRKSIHGQRIFTGWRLQEFLSRSSSHMSKECVDTLLQVSRTFGGGKLPLEEYVFTLRNLVGVNILVEAIGIGQGKKDLTGVSTEPTKTNNVFPIRPEIPVGKAFSSLTPLDIIKFLTGDFRLSKARSNDIFWEAVWPRLLERGWHSEQPKYHIDKRSLVFLIPGVKKFSRRRLVKGNHFFDSVTDVLSKVASEPGLLELEAEVPKDSEQNKEHRWDHQEKEGPHSLSNQHRHCYLKPRVPNCGRDQMKFTIVDTSLVHGEEQSKVTELRSLPVNDTQYSNTSTLETCEETSQESQDEETSDSTLNEIEASVLATESRDRRSSHVSNDIDKRPKKSAKYKSSTESISAGNKLNGEKNIQSTRPPARDHPDEGMNATGNGKCLETEVSPGRTQAQARMLIDLNTIPHVSADLKTDESSIVSETSNKPQLSKLPNDGASEGGEPILNGRRQSTRNRPLSTKALEALACGFPSMERKRKSGESLPRNNSSRSSRRVRGRICGSHISNGTIKEEGGNGTGNSSSSSIIS